MGTIVWHLPNRSKSRLLVKPQFYNDAQATFKGTGIQISIDGCEHLGGAIGTDVFVRKIAEEKIAL